MVSLRSCWTLGRFGRVRSKAVRALLLVIAFIGSMLGAAAASAAGEPAAVPTGIVAPAGATLIGRRCLLGISCKAAAAEESPGPLGWFQEVYD
jgi:hypothetical protein